METEVVAQASRAAAAAAARADVRIEDVHDRGDLVAVSRLFDEVWGRDRDAPGIMSPELLTALVHAGNQVTAAWDDARLVAATAAFVGIEDGLHLHSHVTGVVDGVQGRGIGWALKQHQRAWALARGITEVRWTFDPLIRRNAVFNVAKLGARPVRFVEDAYGAMPDARNAGLPTDRVVVRWALTDRRVVLAAEGRAGEPRIDALRGAGARTVLDDVDGEPRTSDVAGQHLLLQLPADIEAMRASDRDRAARWAAAGRATLGVAMRKGYRVTGCTRDGWLVLTSEGLEELA